MVLESIPLTGLSILLIVLGFVFLGIGYYLRRNEEQYSDYVLTAGGGMLIAGFLLIGYFISSFG